MKRQKKLHRIKSDEYGWSSSHFSWQKTKQKKNSKKKNNKKQPPPKKTNCKSKYLTMSELLSKKYLQLGKKDVHCIFPIDIFCWF